MLTTVLEAYGIEETKSCVLVLGNGLINRTWKIETPQGDFVLQRINEAVFKDPEDIATNIRLIADYLSSHHPSYTFIAPIATLGGKQMHVDGSGFYRLFPFLKASHTIDAVQTPKQAFEAAAQFGRFTKLLSSFNLNKLRTTFPHFHDLNLRYEQFLSALKEGNQERIVAAGELIQTLQRHSNIVEQYNAVLTNPGFKLRVTHHDTKISNVLFNDAGKGLCVIDLDTVMQGRFISDVGDMMRTYLSPVSEEETDSDKNCVREEFYAAIVKGYLGELRDELTDVEKAHFFYAGTFMVYMQALRFLTDYLNNDSYYGARYPEHNLMRAKNQAALLERLLEKEAQLKGLSIA